MSGYFPDVCQCFNDYFLIFTSHISDFDEDDFVSSADLRQVINRLTGEQQLSDEDMQQLINNVSDKCVKLTETYQYCIHSYKHLGTSVLNKVT